MSATTKKPTAPKLQPPTWPTAIEGLDELEKVASEAYSRLVLTRHRRREAEAEVAVKVAQREDLVRRAKAGEVVPGQEIAEVEAAIRAAESTAAILGEAIPGIEAEVEAADEAIRSKAQEPRRAMQQQARAFFEAAQQATKDAQKVEQEAWALLNGLGGSHSFGLVSSAQPQIDADVQRYAPDAHARQLEWRKRKQQRVTHAAPAPGPRIQSAHEIMQSRYGA